MIACFSSAAGIPERMFIASLGIPCYAREQQENLLVLGLVKAEELQSVFSQMRVDLERNLGPGLRPLVKHS